MPKFLFSCFMLVALAFSESEPAGSQECETDSGSEECVMRMELLQGKMHVDVHTADGESNNEDVVQLSKAPRKRSDNGPPAPPPSDNGPRRRSDNGPRRRSDNGPRRRSDNGRRRRRTTESDTTTETDTTAAAVTTATTTSTTATAATTATTTTTSATTTTTEWQSPYFAMTCSGTQIVTTSSLTFSQYDAAVASVQALYNSLSTTCTANDCPQADFAGCVLRIAGHDFMDYKDGEGGSDGCIDFHDSDNAGLAECIHTGEHGVALADAYVDFCTSISLADFFVIAAEAVMNVTRQNVLDDDATRSALDLRSDFRWGRTTALSCSFAEGRLPNPENSCSAVNATFVQSMGLSWSEAAALSGVHTLGRAVVSNSGYNGWWSDSVNSRKFNNNYFTSIVLKGWAPETSVNGNSAKNQWQRVDSGVDEATLGKEMMLNTDLCLYFTMDDAGAVEIDAATGLANDCNCTWPTHQPFAAAIATYNNGKYCGSVDFQEEQRFEDQRALCCGSTFDSRNDATIDCGLPNQPLGPAASDVRNFANNEDNWLRDFAKAWKTATTNGFSLTKLKDD